MMNIKLAPLILIAGGFLQACNLQSKNSDQVSADSVVKEKFSKDYDCCRRYQAWSEKPAVLDTSNFKLNQFKTNKIFYSGSTPNDYYTEFQINGGAEKEHGQTLIISFDDNNRNLKLEENEISYAELKKRINKNTREEILFLSKPSRRVASGGLMEKHLITDKHSYTVVEEKPISQYHAYCKTIGLIIN